jgi:hypothetical protein
MAFKKNLDFFTIISAGYNLHDYDVISIGYALVGNPVNVYKTDSSFLDLGKP